MKIGIIIGSTRPEAVAKWALQIAKTRNDAEYEIVDIKDFNLPLFDETVSPASGQYTKEHSKKWSKAIAPLDAFVFVTPEYNHSVSGALKNAIDFLHNEWKDKAAGFIGYGSLGAARAIEHLRGIMGELAIADVKTQVSLSLMTDFENFRVFKPAPFQEKYVHTMLDELGAWGRALKSVREKEAAVVNQS